jgi:hypothetical protein
MMQNKMIVPECGNPKWLEKTMKTADDKAYA